MNINLFKNDLKLQNKFVSQNYQELIHEINSLENNLKNLSDSELRIESFKLQKEYQETKNLNLLISKSFALTREASCRTLGLRHFDVQLMGGLVLNNNKIAEMKTGEGKTLVATLPASLNALTKKGVHIVTVNDYLANRDQVSMGQIYRFLGFDTGLIQGSMSQKNRQENYKSDITYVTNSELTFDYLRDNTTKIISQKVLRNFNYCIIDEVDSILIDEAQTPIILANPGIEVDTEKYIISSEIIKYLDLNIHYKVDEKNQNVILTEQGNQQVEKITQINDLYNPKDPWIPYIINALKAYTLFFNNTHYIIQNNKIVIVDQFTGRIMPNRQWGDGLHQAVQAKEKLPIQPRSETQASITYQNFFLLYPKFSGMTGTGKTAEIEFEKIYKRSVSIIPTFRLTKRVDLPDLIYKDQFSKWDAVAQFCNEISSTGQPILIGTTTVEKSDMLAQLLNEYKLSYQILNAKPENVRRESQIIAQAGKKKSITIATNMAGRGTDIILGGNIKFSTQRDLYYLLISARFRIPLAKLNIYKYYREFFNEIVWLLLAKHEKIYRHLFIKVFTYKKFFKRTLGCSHKFYSILFNLRSDLNYSNLSFVDILRILQENDRVTIPRISYQCSIRFLINELNYINRKHHNQENQIIKNLGGLCVIGTERNDSRRIDNQLRGRCGRQGDPGTSRFFLSLDDNLLRLFGGAKIQNLMQKVLPDDAPLESNFLTTSLESAQKRVEERAYEQRKNLFDYDYIINKQRNVIYLERQLLLEHGLKLKNNLGFSEQFICEFFNKVLSNNFYSSIYDLFYIFENLFGQRLEIYDIKDFISIWDEFELDNCKVYYYQQLWLTSNLKLNETSVHGSNIFNKLEADLTLNYIDNSWQEYLEKIILLREAVGWRGYGQKNPLIEYRREAFYLFNSRAESLCFYMIYNLFRSNLV